MLRRIFAIPVLAIGLASALAAGAVAVEVTAQVAAPADPATQIAAVDRVFQAWTERTPGCAVGVSEQGRPVLERAYGMADLEHDIANRADTIFEAGSVSKQFTAAAVLVLARDGKLSLDDPVRTYVPELPDYGVPLTIRHMLTHTSGLRDWGSLMAIAGMPRGSRTYTHDHVVDILSRQEALNFTPGSHWSYSNSGYNLAAVIVARVSGMSFAEFSRTRLFEPLGLTHTSWRDDYRRVVPGRAIAYAPASGDRFLQDMPFEDVHGNGGLLTTVGDLLTWNAAVMTGPMSGPDMGGRQHTLATLTDGQTLHYGLGVFRSVYKGLPEIYHSGSTAGYRAFLTYYEPANLSVAVLCNAANANATQLTRAVSDLYLGDRLRPGVPRPPVLVEAQGPLVGVERDESYQPSAAELAAFVGHYVSDEIETTLDVSVDEATLQLHRRPATTIRLRPHSRDRFEGLGLVTFTRDAGGRVTGLTVTQDRVWKLMFRISQ